jgi:hypothetical protein
MLHCINYLLRKAPIKKKMEVKIIKIRDPHDRLCGLVVRVSGYRSRGPGFDSRPYQIF